MGPHEPQLKGASKLMVWGAGGWVLLGPMGRWSPKGHFGPLAQITEAAAVAFPGKQQGHFATLPMTG